MQHNERLTKMGLNESATLPDELELERVFDLYTIWLYRVGGEKYLKAKDDIKFDL